MKLDIILNGEPKSYLINEDEYLLDVLRNNGITSVKRSCDSSSCAMCTVLLEGKPILSCSFLAARAQGKAVTTVEGIQKEVAEFFKAMNQEGAIQCGYCDSALAVTVYAMVKELGTNLSDEQIRHYVGGNVCRCSGYMSQMRAIKTFLGGLK